MVGALGCIRCTQWSSRSHASTPQASLAVTHHILTAAHSTYPEAMEARVELVRFVLWTLDLPHTWVSTCVRATDELTNWTSQAVHTRAVLQLNYWAWPWLSIISTTFHIIHDCGKKWKLHVKLATVKNDNGFGHFRYLTLSFVFCLTGALSTYLSRQKTVLLKKPSLLLDMSVQVWHLYVSKIMKCKRNRLKWFSWSRAIARVFMCHEILMDWRQQYFGHQLVIFADRMTRKKQHNNKYVRSVLSFIL